VVRETRKLAAILAADVVGYSRLAGADEDRTLARMRALRSDLLDPTIAVHNGRVVKRTGDGALVEALEVARKALELRPGFRSRFVFEIGLLPQSAGEFAKGARLLGLPE
jgi:adenylate cyclase